MHTHIILAVQADSHEEAVEVANGWNESNASWSDWYTVGGRYDNEGDTISYAETPEKFMELVKRNMAWTQQAKDDFLEGFGDITLKDILTNPKYSFRTMERNITGELTNEQRDQMLTDSLVMFRAKRALKLYDGDFTSDQHFFDTVEYSADAVGLVERTKENPSEQYLVVMDYHF